MLKYKIDVLEELKGKVPVIFDGINTDGGS